MNREIKFRVWDKEENKFFKPIYEAYKGHLLDLSISLSGQFLRRTLSLPAENESCFPDKYELNQFTGLKDKNGVEIYEGDLIKYKDFKGISQIRFEKGSFFFYGISVIHFLFNVKESSIEVIGNIYEHKHLLE